MDIDEFSQWVNRLAETGIYSFEEGSDLVHQRVVFDESYRPLLLDGAFEPGSLLVVENGELRQLPPGERGALTTEDFGDDRTMGYFVEVPATQPLTEVERRGA